MQTFHRYAFKSTAHLTRGCIIFAIAKIASPTYPKFGKIICGAFIDCLSKKEDLLYDKFADENHIREETNSYQSI